MNVLPSKRLMSLGKGRLTDYGRSDIKLLELRRTRLYIHGLTLALLHLQANEISTAPHLIGGRT
jgi:hypothetical protein